ncbi:MAG TPA: hypothetical protein VFK37_03475 [Bacillales bacterium]|nr:hypothetical protein [Bacillales bacterium]
MSDERFDKLLNFMTEMKQIQEEMKLEQQELRQEMAEMRHEMSELKLGLTEKVDNLGNDINLLAQKQWESERYIHRLQQIIL